MKLEDHPTVKQVRLQAADSAPPKNESLDAQWLKQLVLDAGADDVGFVEIGRSALDDQRQDILQAFPHTKPYALGSKQHLASMERDSVSSK